MALIVKGDNETLQIYLDRFTTKARVAKDVPENIKCFLFINGLVKGSLFHVNISADKPETYADLLERAKLYMSYDYVLPVWQKGTRM